MDTIDTLGDFIENNELLFLIFFDFKNGCDIATSKLEKLPVKIIGLPLEIGWLHQLALVVHGGPQSRISRKWSGLFRAGPNTTGKLHAKKR